MRTLAPGGVGRVFGLCGRVGIQGKQAVAVKQFLCAVLNAVEQARQPLAADVCHVHADAGLRAGTIHEAAHQFAQ